MQPFGAPVADASLNSVATEGKAFVSADGTRAFFASDRGGGSGGFDLWRGARAGATGPFNIDRTYLNLVDDQDAQLDPHLSTDLLRLYLAPRSAQGQYIAFASRGNTSQDFPAPTQIAQLALVGGQDAGPTLTADERVIVFSSNVAGHQDLYYATRASLNDAFSVPAALPQLASTGIDGAPHLSGDGCRVYFMSTRNGSRDLFVASML